jgi:hypothetical protein
MSEIIIHPNLIGRTVGFFDDKSNRSTGIIMAIYSSPNAEGNCRHLNFLIMKDDENDKRLLYEICVSSCWLK